MWAAIELGAAVLMYFICKRVQAPLDAYKNAGALATPKSPADAQEMEAGSNSGKAAAPYEE